MVRIAWTTDVHLNFLLPEEVEHLCQKLLADDPDAILVGGDISESDRLREDLRSLESRFGRPLYFVLGNHDFYRGSIEGVREMVAGVAGEIPLAHYLPQAGVVEVSEHVALVGVDGWGDGRLGNVLRSPVNLNDFVLIRELKGLSHTERLALLNELGKQEAARLRGNLAPALARYPRVVVLTHVPPFREAAWHDGRPSGEDWLPYFSCRATGEVIMELALCAPHAELTVLCGHTHGGGEVRPLPNVRVLTGFSDYRIPRVELLEL